MIDLLSDVKILDFSARLPGPFATFILKDLGAKVIKLENTDIDGDPFNSDLFKKFLPNFPIWYRNLNQDKEIKALSFQENSKKIQALIDECDLIIAPENSFFKLFLEKFNFKNDHALILFTGSQSEWKHLHDLNALAMTKSFLHHLKAHKTPPFLPLGALAFGQYMATCALATLRKAEKKQEFSTITLYLDEVTRYIFDALFCELKQNPNGFLHNGVFPCYNVYETQDGHYVCLAAVEAKYWQKFCNLFNLEIIKECAFDSSDKTKNLLKKTFLALSAKKIRETLANENICLSIVTDKKD